MIKLVKLNEATNLTIAEFFQKINQKSTIFITIKGNKNRFMIKLTSVAILCRFTFTKMYNGIPSCV